MPTERSKQHDKLLKRIAKLESDLEDERTVNESCRRSHGILARGIKKALQLKNWPEFRELYGSGLFTDGVVRLLNEEVQKLRDRNGMNTKEST